MDAVALAEQAKYRKMWDRPEYRVWSPGEDGAADGMEAFGLSSVIDFGCGDGKALDKFLAAGMEAIGVDLVALCEGVVEACLWDLPAGLKPTSWGFCADVMEHVQEDKVDAVLANISAKVRRGCYFRISTVPDGMGALIGETLHLTVKPSSWWAVQIAKHFLSSVEVDAHDGYCVVIARKP